MIQNSPTFDHHSLPKMNNENYFNTLEQQNMSLANKIFMIQLFIRINMTNYGYDMTKIQISD